MCRKILCNMQDKLQLSCEDNLISGVVILSKGIMVTSWLSVVGAAQEQTVSTVFV